MLVDFIKKIKSDGNFRMKVLLLLSTLFNAAYAVFLLVVGLLNTSWWFCIMAAYYGLLSLVRVFIWAQINPNRGLKSQIKTMLICGCCLLVVNVAIAGLMLILIFGNRPVDHHEITVITLATYTFSTLTFAIINSVKRLKKNDYVSSCVQLVNLVSACVSIVTLTYTMLATFGDGEATLRQVIMPILSVTVSAFIIVCAILMIRKASLDLRKLKNEEK